MSVKENYLRNALTAELATWLDSADQARILPLIRSWDDATWQLAKQVAIMQGIGPYLGSYLPNTALYPTLPGWFRDWLQTTHTRNAERISRMHADLGIILHAANQVGIPVLLLKGSLLTTCFYEQPAMRPMADLDLLVHPTDRQRFGQLLVEHGYRYTQPKGRWSDHDAYANTTCEKVVMADEHPGNPRPVEVHWGLAQRFWGAFPLPDLASALWETSHPETILGATAHIPAPETHLAFTAMHHLKHLLLETGRLIQWLDIAHLIHTIPPDVSLPFQNMLYPVLRFAARVFPSHFLQVDWQKMTQGVHPRVQHWCEFTPLDQRCGLQVRMSTQAEKRWRLRWLRWHPSPLRLALTFQDSTLPVAYLKYAATVLRNII